MYFIEQGTKFSRLKAWKVYKVCQLSNIQVILIGTRNEPYVFLAVNITMLLKQVMLMRAKNVKVLVTDQTLTEVGTAWVSVACLNPVLWRLQ
jgi:hypothetical protein